MSNVRVHAAAVVPATPERVYGTLADYRSAHPQILPPNAFAGLEVEQGGYGAGTVFRVSLRNPGGLKEMRMAVTEPEPGRVLVESDLDSDLVTTFTVQPADNSQQSHVEIETRWTARSGLAGMVDRWVMPPLMRMVFRQELKLLERYLAQNAVAAQ